LVGRNLTTEYMIVKLVTKCLVPTFLGINLAMENVWNIGH